MKKFSLIAYQFNPNRIEPLYLIMLFYRKKQKYWKAYKYLCMIDKI